MSIYTRTLILALTLSSMSLTLAAEQAQIEKPGFNEATLKGLEWRNIGPALMAGRIADIAIDHQNRSTWYVGVGKRGRIPFILY